MFASFLLLKENQGLLLLDPNMALVVQGQSCAVKALATFLSRTQSQGCQDSGIYCTLGRAKSNGLCARNLAVCQAPFKY